MRSALTFLRSRPADRTRRRACLAVLGVVYLLPSVLGTLLHATHNAEHFLVGLVEVDPRPSRALVHTHDGTTHAHGPAVAALAAALEADQDDATDEDPEAVPPVILMAAVAGTTSTEAILAVRVESGVRIASPAPRWDPGTPPVPPPRA